MPGESIGRIFFLHGNLYVNLQAWLFFKEGMKGTEVHTKNPTLTTNIIIRFVKAKKDGIRKYSSPKTCNLRFATYLI